MHLIKYDTESKFDCKCTITPVSSCLITIWRCKGVIFPIYFCPVKAKFYSRVFLFFFFKIEVCIKLLTNAPKFTNTNADSQNTLNNLGISASIISLSLSTTRYHASYTQHILCKSYLDEYSTSIYRQPYWFTLYSSS